TKDLCFLKVTDYYCRSIFFTMGKCSAGFFVPVFSVNDNGISGFAESGGAVPDLFHERARSIVLNCINSNVIKYLFRFEGSPECGDYYYVVSFNFIPRYDLLAVGFHYKFNSALIKVGIYLLVMDHFTEQENAFVRVFFNSFV